MPRRSGPFRLPGATTTPEPRFGFGLNFIIYKQALFAISERHASFDH
jgi:hypothetical protein